MNRNMLQNAVFVHVTWVTLRKQGFWGAHIVNAGPLVFAQNSSWVKNSFQEK